MARLPVSGGDDGTWGDILNTFLLQSHKSDGTLQDNAVGTATIQANAVTNAKLDAATQAILAAADRSTTLVVAAANSASKSQATADYVCDGTNDEAEINAALAALPGGKGRVVLMEGTYHQLAPISLATYNSLEGQGLGTLLQAEAGFSGAGQVTLATNTTEQTRVTGLAINGFSSTVLTAVDGIHYDNSGSNAFPFLHSDAHHLLADLFIYNTRGDGFALVGSTNVGARVTMARNVVVYTCSGKGFNITSSDCKFNGCTAQNNFGTGFQIGSFAASSQFVNCKSGGSGANGGFANNALNGIGFRVTSGRVQLTDCQAQDNYATGYSIENESILTGCVADSNGLGSTPGAGTGIGFDFKGNFIIASGCHSTDRNSGSARWQATAYQIESGFDHIRLEGTGHNNITTDLCNNLSAGANIRTDVAYALPGTAVQSSGSAIGSESAINFIAGANVTVAAVDNPGSARVDVTLSAAGSGGGVQSWLPSAHGLLAWTDDVASNTTTAQPTSQQIVLEKFFNPIGQTINNISVYVNTLGSGLTAAYFGVYDLTGTRLALTNDVSATLTTTGAKTSALTTSLALTAATYYWVAVLVVGTTPPQYIGPPTLGSPQINFGLGVATARVATVAGTNATLPASFTPSSNALSGRRIWCGLS